MWPLDGMNCWEVTAHFVGVALALRPDITLHVYDVDTSDGGRHVFPAIQGPLGTGPSYEVLLQPEPPRAQSWYNTIADIAHGIGSAVLGVFGVGALVPLVEQAWKEAPEEYGLSKNQKKPEEAPQKQPQSRDIELQTLRRKLARLVGKGTGQSPISRTSGGGDGTRQPNPQIPPDRDTAVVEEPDDWQGTEEPSDTDAEVVDYSEGSDAEDGGVTDTDAESVDFGDGGGAGE